MAYTIKPERKACVAMVFATIALLPATGFAQSKPITTTDLLQHLRKGEPWDKSVFTATKTVNFQQDASGSDDATVISKITLSYFSTTDCTGPTLPNTAPTYTTPNGTTFTINTTTPFGIVAASVWNVGNSKVTPTVVDTYGAMTDIQSVAVTFKSTNNNTPQASFTGISFACVPVTCGGGECTSVSGQQNFQLKTTAAVGDPADGGIIGCLIGNSTDAFNLIVPASDNNEGNTIAWSATADTTTATSKTDGATNTDMIVAALSPAQAVGSYAAGVCSSYSAAGGYTSDWFLPAGGNIAGTQQNCFYTNKAAIATGATVSGGSGFADDRYWSSTQDSSTGAWRENFTNGGNQISSSLANSFRVRCCRAFTP